MTTLEAARNSIKALHDTRSNDADYQIRQVTAHYLLGGPETLETRGAMLLEALVATGPSYMTFHTRRDYRAVPETVKELQLRRFTLDVPKSNYAPSPRSAIDQCITVEVAVWDSITQIDLEAHATLTQLKTQLMQKLGPRASARLPMSAEYILHCTGRRLEDGKPLYIFNVRNHDKIVVITERLLD